MDPLIRGSNSVWCFLGRDFACGNRRVGTTLNLMVKYLPAASLDAIFAALSDPTRRRILDRLTCRWRILFSAVNRAARRDQGKWTIPRGHTAGQVGLYLAMGGQPGTH